MKQFRVDDFGAGCFGLFLAAVIIPSALIAVWWIA